MRERNYTIDVLKGLAIISVILLHTLTWKHRFLIGAPYHIWQAVPIFMLLAGYNFAKSTNIKGHTSLKEVYRWSIIVRRLFKIIVPFIFIVITRLIIQFIITNHINWETIIAGLFIGDFEHGGYFIPVLIQTILIVPSLYVFIVKKMVKNTIFLLIFSYILDWSVMLMGMSGALYRISIIRYLFIIVLGLWLGLNNKKINYKYLFWLAGGSIIYITSIYYFRIETPLETYWQAQHAPAYFWTLLIVIIFTDSLHIHPDNLINNILIRIGQSSYHIYLVQMIYFWLLDQFELNLPLTITVILNLGFCIVLGLLFEKYIDF